MKKLILISAMLLLLCSCGSFGKGIKAGETIATNQQCLAASSQDSFDKLNKVCNRKDSQELSRMINNKEAFILDKGTKIKVTDLKFGTVIGEVRSGALMFESVYVSREFVE